MNLDVVLSTKEFVTVVIENPNNMGQLGIPLTGTCLKWGCHKRFKKEEASVSEPGKGTTVFCTHIFVHSTHRVIIPYWYVIIIHMYNAYPYLSLKNLGKKVSI